MSSYPITRVSCVANLFSRMMHFQKKGDKENGHSHVFNHLTLLAKGSLEVTVDGQTTVFTAPHMIYIRKDKLHELTALEDDTLAFCIHALRDGEGVDDILDPDSIPQGTDLMEIAKKIVREPN